MALVDQPLTVDDVGFPSIIEHIVLCCCFSQGKVVLYTIILLHCLQNNKSEVKCFLEANLVN